MNLIYAFPGEKPATKEQIAAEIEKSLQQIAAGDYEEVELD